MLTIFDKTNTDYSFDFSGFNADLEASESGLEDQFGTLLKTIVITRGQVVRVYAILVVVAVCT